MNTTLCHRIEPGESILSIAVTYAPLWLDGPAAVDQLGALNPSLDKAQVGDLVRIPDPWRDEMLASGTLSAHPDFLGADDETPPAECDKGARWPWVLLGGIAGYATAMVVGGVLYMIYEDKITSEVRSFKGRAREKASRIGQELRSF
jgi:hypothetical protein